MRLNSKAINNSTNISSGLECKECIKFLGVLIDDHLSWKYHVDYITVKISEIVGVIARLRHFVPFSTLMLQTVLLQTLSLKNLWGPARFIHIIRAFHLIANIILNFHVWINSGILFSALARKRGSVSHLNSVCSLPKLAFTKSIRKALFAALEGEDDYIEAPNLLSKINLYLT